MNNLKKYPKKIFLLSGLSESGKSSAGEYFNTIGIKRMKFVRILADQELRKNQDINPYEYAAELTKVKGEEYTAQKFIDNLFEVCNSEKIRYCSIESMIYLRTTYYIKSKLPEQSVVIYFDMSEESRLKRQMIRRGVDFEKAKELMLPRDEIKKSYGAHQIRDIADIVINNEGDLEDLYSKLLEVAKKYCELE